MGQRRVTENKGGPKGGKNLKSPLKKKNERQASSRRRAIMESRRNSEFADKVIGKTDLAETSLSKKKAYLRSEKDKLRVIPIGGNEGGGGMNMIVLEYDDEAIVVDSGLSLGIDLPGVNYGINSDEYLETIKHKIKAWVFTHGHLDHIGAAPYLIPKYPAKVYGSNFTIGMVQKQFDGFEKNLDFEPEMVIMNIDNHERQIISKNFTLELVRVTHSIPESTCVVVDTPAGRVINTGDFRLDPEPLDHMPSDIARLKELGKEGVAVLLSESTTTYKPGRTPTEHTLEKSFQDLIGNASGRVFVASFSSNINRVQMIIDSTVAAGRKVAFDGRSMLAHIELAVRLGLIKIPQGAVASMRDLSSLDDNKVVAVVTGGQGELNASLQRMSIGEHKYFKLKKGDTVVVSSNPIPGNGRAYEQIADDLTRLGVTLFRSPTHEIDGCGPLHVSGHASRDEHREMIQMTNPKYFVPIYGGPKNRQFHIDMAIEEGVGVKNCFSMENGQVLEVDKNKAVVKGEVPTGTVLIDQTASVVPGVVAKDRLLMMENGIVTVILTVNRGSGQLMTNPDIISRGFIYLRENEEIVNEIRKEAKFIVLRKFKKSKNDNFKQELKDHIQHVIYKLTKRSPLVIPVVNVIGGNGRPAPRPKPKHEMNDGHERS